MYIYKTTNLINNKIYIGKSEYGVDENPEYLGSGVVLKKAIKKYGRENFQKEILIETNDINELNKLEKENIKFFKEKFKDNCYNIAEGGNGGNSHKYKTTEEKKQFSEYMSKVNSEHNGFRGKRHSDETKKIISNKNKGFKPSNEHIEKLRSVNLGNQYNLGRKYSDEVNAKKVHYGKDNGMYGKTHSAETIELISEKIKESKKEKHICLFCGKSVDKGNYNRWHGEKCKENPNISQEQINTRSPWNKKSSTTSKT